MTSANRTGELLGQLTAHLVRLAEQLGYQVELDELDAACAFYTRQVLDWAEAGTGHAALTYQRNLLAGPISFLQQHPDRTNHTLLGDLLDQDRWLEAAQDAASRRYADACQTLYADASGLIWSHETAAGADASTTAAPGQPPASDPPADVDSPAFRATVTETETDQP